MMLQMLGNNINNCHTCPAVILSRGGHYFLNGSLDQACKDILIDGPGDEHKRMVDFIVFNEVNHRN